MARIEAGGQGLGLLGVAKITLALEEITKVKVDVRTPRLVPRSSFG
jgi:hypothetical protein